MTDLIRPDVTGAEFGAEPRLLIDGKLVEARSGETYDNINPATEEVIGQARRRRRATTWTPAIAAARRAFDETDWSTEPRVPQALPRAAAGGDRRRAGAAPRRDRRRGRHARCCHVRGRSSTSRSRTLQWPADADRRRSSGSATLARRHGVRHAQPAQVVKEPVGVVGAITPWNFPFKITLRQARPGARGRQHRGPQAGARHAVERHVHRPARRRGDRHPAPASSTSSPASDHAVGEQLVDRPARRHDLVHRLDRGRQAHHGRRGAATLKRVFLELGGKSANIVLDDADFAAHARRCGMVVHARRPGLRDHDPAARRRGRGTTRASSSSTAAFEGVTYGDPTDPATCRAR